MQSRRYPQLVTHNQRGSLLAQPLFLAPKLYRSGEVMDVYGARLHSSNVFASVLSAPQTAVSANPAFCHSPPPPSPSVADGDIDMCALEDRSPHRGTSHPRLASLTTGADLDLDTILSSLPSTAVSSSKSERDEPGISDLGHLGENGSSTPVTPPVLDVAELHRCHPGTAHLLQGDSDALDPLPLLESDDFEVPFNEETLNFLSSFEGESAHCGVDPAPQPSVHAQLSNIIGLDRSKLTNETSVQDGRKDPRYKPWTSNDYNKLQKVLRLHGPYNWLELQKVFPERCYEEIMEMITYYFPASLCHLENWGEEEHNRLFDIIGSVVDWSCVARRMSGRGIVDIRRYYYGLLRR